MSSPGHLEVLTAHEDDDDAAPRARAAHTNRAEESTVTKIIVADDHPAMRALVASRLREAGYDVIEVGDGNILWSQVQESVTDDDNPRDADLIVSDIRMPGASGLEVLARLRSAHWTTPVILMTAFGDPATHQSARELGATMVLNNPFDLAELVAAALRLIGPA